MTMLNMDYRAVQLKTMNPRIEHHGEETVRAVDLVFGFKTVNTVLDELSEGLRLAFFRPADQHQLPGTELANELRWPEVKSFKWDEVVKDVVFVVHSKLHDEPDMAFAESKVGKVKVLPENGGSVGVTFMAQVYADPVQISRLYSLLDEGCKVSWRPMNEDELDAMAARQKSLFPTNATPDGPGEGEGEGDGEGEGEGDGEQPPEAAQTRDTSDMQPGDSVQVNGQDRDAQQLQAVADTMRAQDAAKSAANDSKPSNIARAIKRNEVAAARKASDTKKPTKKPAKAPAKKTPAKTPPKKPAKPTSSGKVAAAGGV